MEILGAAHETAVHDTTIAWGELGDGPPLVLLHGLMDSHRTWRRAATHLARHFRLLMPDLPGCGGSGRPDAPYSLAWHSEVLAAWMASIGVDRAHVCGHSYGAGIAQWMLLEQRARVDRLALVSAGGLGRQVALGMRLASFPVLGRRLTPVAIRHLLPTVLRLTATTFGHMEPEEIECFVRWSRLPGTDVAFQRSLEGVINFFGQYVHTMDRVHEVAELPPIAIFWGTKDPILPLQHAKEMLARAEGVSLTRYEGCGHYPHLDHPERFSRDLAAFLNDPERPRVRLRTSPCEGRDRRRP
ncbi:MAG: alpha/beta fold hydrolase [Deltaproteobacteria bacterium]|nr:alpha/beta fold hydrolase [Deltaproteobacteria bacterium]